MGTKKKVLTFLVFAGMMLFTAQSALGGCEVAALDPLIIDGNAPGTKLEGPLTVFYKWVSHDPDGPAWTADMYWFLRLRHGSKFYSFAGGPEEVLFPTEILTMPPIIIGDFFADIVIPNLYKCNPEIPGECPEVVLKSYDMDVSWEPPGDNGGLYYFIADIVIAVQD